MSPNARRPPLVPWVFFVARTFSRREYRFALNILPVSVFENKCMLGMQGLDIVSLLLQFQERMIQARHSEYVRHLVVRSALPDQNCQVKPCHQI